MKNQRGWSFFFPAFLGPRKIFSRGPPSWWSSTRSPVFFFFFFLGLGKHFLLLLFVVSPNVESHLSRVSRSCLQIVLLSYNNQDGHSILPNWTFFGGKVEIKRFSSSCQSISRYLVTNQIVGSAWRDKVKYRSSWMNQTGALRVVWAAGTVKKKETRWQWEEVSFLFSPPERLWPDADRSWPASKRTLNRSI